MVAKGVHLIILYWYCYFFRSFKSNLEILGPFKIDYFEFIDRSDANNITLHKLYFKVVQILEKTQNTLQDGIFLYQ